MKMVKGLEMVSNIRLYQHHGDGEMTAKDHATAKSTGKSKRKSKSGSRSRSRNRQRCSKALDRSQA